MKKTWIIILVVVCLCVAGITGVATYKYLDERHSEETEKPNEEKPTKPEKPEEKPEQPVEYNDTDFNVNLIKTVNSTQKDNYLVSPYSIEIALNMLRDGADGNTKAEIDKVIGNRQIPVFTAKNRISVVNGAFIKNDYKDLIEKSYYDKLDSYKAELIFDEFKTPNKINAWVKKNTYDMIPKILDEMNEEFVLGLANAVAIDVEWYSGFKCENTRSQEFTKTDGTKMNTEMMYKNYVNQYFEIDGAKGVVLNYEKYNSNGEEIDSEEEGTQLEFVGILPNGSVKEFIDGLSKEKLESIDKSYVDLANKDVNLSLPRFSYEFDLKNFMDVLKAMGIKDVFDDEKADLTKIITADKYPSMEATNIYVAQAIHKTYIDLNENGTKAAAVTYFGIEKANSAFPQEREVINIVFNKPFVYMIRDSKTKEILFFGVVETPNVWKGSTCSNK